jgi:flagellar FliL protein
MASANPDDPDAGSAPKGGLMGLLIPIVVLTVIAAGGGGLIGMQIVSAVKNSGAGPKPPAAAAAQAEPQIAVKELAPIVTNLATPDNASWVRLQTAIVYEKADAPQIEVMSSRIGDDMLAFVRTLTLDQIQGASGLQHLREDLNERASIRSDGHVRELMIETLVVQ